MPIYEYKCESTGKVFEVRQNINAEPLTTCIIEGCSCEGNGKANRLISKNIGLIFNGSGFYQTDYVKNNSKHEAEPVVAPHSSACSCCNKAKTCPSSDN